MALINLRNALMSGGKQLPYNSEVEYLRVDAVGPYIDIDGVTYCNAVGTYYAFTISSDGVITHDLIPVRRGNTGYMYDRITNQLFGNSGAGYFVLGPDVVPVEYIESYGAEWIATGVNAAATSSSLRTVAALRFTTLSSGEHDLMGSGNVATPTIGRNGANYFMWAKTGTSWSPTDCDTNWHTVSYTFSNPSGRVFELDGVSYTGTQGNTFKTGNGVYLFASSPNRYPLECQLAKLEIWQDGNLIRNYIPVRVGTYATSWEGAMMDTLTRRIYRNAGTGAFGYGNDREYPIPSE